jgi:hypothetical protein
MNPDYLKPASAPKSTCEQQPQTTVQVSKKNLKLRIKKTIRWHNINSLQKTITFSSTMILNAWAVASSTS